MKIRDLKKWMREECFNEHTYTIGIKPAPFEGFGLEEREEDGKFIWYFTERGGIKVLKSFAEEEEACLYAFEQMKNDRLARIHLVGFFEQEERQKRMRREIAERGIEFQTDKILFEKDIFRYRVFVFGCDHKRVADLAEKYKKLEPKARWRNR